MDDMTKNAIDMLQREITATELRLKELAEEIDRADDHNNANAQVQLRRQMTELQNKLARDKAVLEKMKA